MTQFGKLPRPLAGAPRNDFAGPLSGFKRPQSPMAKIAELDAAFADVGRRLTVLEKGSGIAKAATPMAEGARP